MTKGWAAIEQKICKDTDVVVQRSADWQCNGLKVVFTNGCFDLMHLGHLSYLADAAALGDRLIVGVNSDTSVKNLKGPERPIKNEAERMAQLAALQFVDAVILFSEDTPLRLIQRIQPDILVKGGDYTLDQIVGAEEVIAAGGKVQTIDFLEGYSSSSLIKKIKTL